MLLAMAEKTSVHIYQYIWIMGAHPQSKLALFYPSKLKREIVLYFLYWEKLNNITTIFVDLNQQPASLYRHFVVFDNKNLNDF